MGASPVHVPLVLHSLVRSPLKVNPGLQSYLTMEPTLLLVTVTIPFSGFGKSSQVTGGIGMVGTILGLGVAENEIEAELKVEIETGVILEVSMEEERVLGVKLTAGVGIALVLVEVRIGTGEIEELEVAIEEEIVIGVKLTAEVGIVLVLVEVRIGTGEIVADTLRVELEVAIEEEIVLGVKLTVSETEEIAAGVVRVEVRTKDEESTELEAGMAGKPAAGVEGVKLGKRIEEEPAVDMVRVGEITKEDEVLGIISEAMIGTRVEVGRIEEKLTSNVEEKITLLVTEELRAMDRPAGVLPVKNAIIIIIIIMKSFMYQCILVQFRSSLHFLDMF